MRRIFHATTAIVASLSLLAPDLVAAQQAAGTGEAEAGAEVAPKKPRNAGAADQPENGNGDEARQQRRAQPSPENAEPENAEAGGQPDQPGADAAAADDVPAPRAADAEQPAPEEARPATEMPSGQSVPATPAEPETAEQPETVEQDLPAPKPRAVREATPERPAQVQRQVDDTAPDAAPREGRQDIRAPEPAPDAAALREGLVKDVQAADGQAADGQTPPAPNRARANREAGQDQADTPAADAPVGDDPDALRRALAEEVQPPTNPQRDGQAENGPAADGQTANGQTADGQTPPAPDRARPNRGARQDQADTPAPAADAPVGDDPDALRRALAEEVQPPANPERGADGEDSDPNPGQNRIPRAADDAPEAGAVETDAARAAANPQPPAPSEALRALTDRDDDAEAPRGQVSDFTIGEDDARRSDEDFATSVGRSLDEDQIRELREDAQRDDDDDDRGRDIARLALAGLAGYAVGSWMSNDRQVALNTGDRVVVTMPDGSQQLIKNDDTLLFRPGSNVQTESYEDGSSITTVLREDGSRVVTIRDANMNILRRSVVWPDGRSTMLIDDTADVTPVRVADLPPPARPVDYTDQMSEEALRDALMRESSIDRRFSLGQIRNIAQVRALVAPLDIQSITFDTGSAAITPNQAEQLSALGRVIAQSVRDNPGELYLIEGYTDAVGSDASNLALSDRRAESVALALTEYFDVPPENMVVQGYGEQFLRVQTQDAERSNRRVAVRRITDLIEQN